MKFKLMMFSAVAFFATLMVITPAHAQIDQTEKVDIPFDFYAGGKQMPAGTYNIGIDVVNDFIAISDNSGQHQVMLLGSSTDGPSDKAELVFDHTGDSFYLKQLDSNLIDLGFSETKAKKAGLTQSAQVHVPMMHS